MTTKKQEVSISKLIILYFLNTLSFKLSELQIIKAITDNEWANYFDIKENLFELSESDMLKKRETPNGVFYTITDIGKSSISIFYKDILHSVRENIDKFSKDNLDILHRESELFSDYIKLKDDEFRVTLRILEDTSPIFEINLVVYSKEEAEQIMNNWLSSASNIYKYAYTELMNE